MFRFFSIILLLFLLVSSGYADNTEPIKIGLSLGLTGKYSEICNLQIKGFQLWENNVNKKGGILGRKLNLIIYD
jgi:branched-chain amino acid transport system substrate-binding protein